MSEKLDTLVTEEMMEKRDQWSEPRVSRPVSESDIRKWAIAVYWPEEPPKLYWDEEYAKSTRYDGIIAPLDFNPFAWPVPVPPAAPTPPMGTGQGTNAMNGGPVVEYVAPIRPGDVISTSTALVDWNERETRLGLTLFSTNETRWTNQNGELVRISKNTSIRY